MTDLLDPQGTASMATMFLLSHHGLRRDLGLFARTLAEPGNRAAALAEQWATYRSYLHGHHQMEDTAIFPDLGPAHPHLAVVFTLLTNDHRRIDPLLEKGDAAFARLGQGGPGHQAASVLAELNQILYPHLLLEERQVVPLLRSLPFHAPVPDEGAAELMAGGFAWSLHGVHPEVVGRVLALLPPPVLDRLPAAGAAYQARFARAFGPVRAGATKTAEPEW